MRFSVVHTIYKAALKNNKIYFLTGDLGHAYEKEFKTNLPHQYFNIGIAEQNMVGIAAGLALSGMKVFIYSIVPFVTMRCYEQIKNDLCYQNIDVTIIGVGGGFAYGEYGNTHCSIEDIAVMRVLPNMKIVCPSTPFEAQQLTGQILKKSGPFYIRLGRGKEINLTKKYSIELGKGSILKKGKDLYIISCGPILLEAEKIIRLLAQKKIDAGLINLHTIKPIDKKLLVSLSAKVKMLVTVEEHSVIGGLGSSVSEIISEITKKIIFKRFGINDIYLKTIGKQQYLRKKHYVSAESITRSILVLLKK